MLLGSMYNLSRLTHWSPGLTPPLVTDYAGESRIYTSFSRKKKCRCRGLDRTRAPRRAQNIRNGVRIIRKKTHPPSNNFQRRFSPKQSTKKGRGMFPKTHRSAFAPIVLSRKKQLGILSGGGACVILQVTTWWWYYTAVRYMSTRQAIVTPLHWPTNSNFLWRLPVEMVSSSSR